MSRRNLLRAALALGAVLSLSLGSPDTFAADPMGSGGKAPDFPKLRDMAGVEFDTEKDLKGKLTLVNFWATWCQPCMVEMKHLDRLHKAYKDKGFQVVSVSIDDARSKSMVKPIVKRNGYGFRVLYDTETQLVSVVNPAKTLPYNMLIGDDLTVLWTHLGYTPGDEVKMEEKIKANLPATLPASGN